MTHRRGTVLAEPMKMSPADDGAACGPASGGGPRSLEPLQSRWICTALAYVPHVARRYLGCGLPFDELLAAGNLGLVEAALRFEPARKVKFVTYADWWIRKAILKAIEEQSGPVRLPRYRQEQLRALREIGKAWRRKTGREPDADQLALATGLSRKEVDRLSLLGRGALSLDDNTGSANTRPLLDVLAAEDGDGPQDAAVRQDLNRHVGDLVKTLRGKQRTVIILRFGFGGEEPLTLREIGARMGISRERVRQIERRALVELRNSL